VCFNRRGWPRWTALPRRETGWAKTVLRQLEWPLGGHSALLNFNVERLYIVRVIDCQYNSAYSSAGHNRKISPAFGGQRIGA
jgi:hypothetical protein